MVRGRPVVHLDPERLELEAPPTPWDTASALWFLAALLDAAAVVLGLAVLVARG